MIRRAATRRPLRLRGAGVAILRPPSALSRWLRFDFTATLYTNSGYSFGAGFCGRSPFSTVITSSQTAATTRS